MKIPAISIRHVAFSLLLSYTFFSCSNSENSSSPEDIIQKEIKTSIDSSATKMFKYNNVVFCLPSPYQFSFFIKELGVAYNKLYLNSTKNLKQYTSTFKKSVGIGIYGTDLGYLNIYEQTPDAIAYFSVLKALAQDVGLSNTFDATTIKRLEGNMGNKDSLLHILSNTYRKADAYLKENDRNNIAVLILAGGWVESLHIQCEIAKEYEASGNTKVTEAVKQKIAEQKHPLDNLIKILSPYYNHSEEYTTMIDELIELAYEFDGVDYKYTFKEPTTDVENKITYINSISELIISDKQLAEICKKTANLRARLIK